MAVLFTAVSATAATAQEPTDTVAGAAVDPPTVVEREVLGVPVDSARAQATGDLEDALEQLAGRLGALADRVANDPELRSSALRTAEGLLDVTEILVARQSELLLDVLRKASEEISETARKSDSRPAGEGEAPPARR